MNYVPRGVKVLSAPIKMIEEKCKLGILAHISTYGCYAYAFIGGVIYGYPRFYNMKSSSTWYDNYIMLLNPWFICHFNIILMFINQIVVKIPSTLHTIHDRIKFVDKQYK